MGIIASIFFFIGWLIALVGGIMFLVVAFKENIWWGLGCLFIPIVQLIFLVLHWPVAKKPFFIELAGMLLIFLSVVLGGPGGYHFHYTF